MAINDAKSSCCCFAGLVPLTQENRTRTAHMRTGAFVRSTGRIQGWAAKVRAIYSRPDRQVQTSRQSKIGRSQLVRGSAAQRWRSRSPHESTLYALEVADASSAKLDSASFCFFNEPPELPELVVTLFEIAGGVLQPFWTSIHGHSLKLAAGQKKAFFNGAARPSGRLAFNQNVSRRFRFEDRQNWSGNS